MVAPNHWVQFGGALLILIAYALLQLGTLGARSRTFGVMNAVGAGLLAAEAWRTDQYGFFLLEGTWALISVGTLILGRKSAPPTTPKQVDLAE
jgi:hypothetical protein